MPSAATSKSARQRKPQYRRKLPPPVPDQLEHLVLLIRGQRVMQDSDLAALYGVPTKALNQAVQRNLERFPEDFMFVLTDEEVDRLRSQIVTSNVHEPGQIRKKPNNNRNSEGSLRSQIVTSNIARGGRRYLPRMFTEQGVAMLSSVLRSPRAVKINIEIMRVFVRLRQLLAANNDLERRLAELEEQCDLRFKSVFDAIRELLEKPAPLKPEHGREIGFHTIRQLKEDAPAYRCFVTSKSN